MCVWFFLFPFPVSSLSGGVAGGGGGFRGGRQGLGAGCARRAFGRAREKMRTLGRVPGAALNRARVHGVGYFFGGGCRAGWGMELGGGVGVGVVIGFAGGFFCFTLFLLPLLLRRRSRARSVLSLHTALFSTAAAPAKPPPPQFNPPLPSSVHPHSQRDASRKTSNGGKFFLQAVKPIVTCLDIHQNAAVATGKCDIFFLRCSALQKKKREGKAGAGGGGEWRKQEDRAGVVVVAVE